MEASFSPFKRLMQGLYYPAILGTAIILILLRITHEGSLRDCACDMSLYFACLFSAFFSLSFLINEQTEDKDYGLQPFVIDLIEVIFVFWSYYFLGFFDDGTPNPPDQVSMANVYWGALLVIILENLWNLFVGRTDRGLQILSSVVGCFLLAAALWGYPHPIFNWMALTLLSISLAVYFWYSTTS